eukprot:Opistho-2@67726
MVIFHPLCVCVCVCVHVCVWACMFVCVCVNPVVKRLLRKWSSNHYTRTHGVKHAVFAVCDPPVSSHHIHIHTTFIYLFSIQNESNADNTRNEVSCRLGRATAELDRLLALLAAAQLQCAQFAEINRSMSARLEDTNCRELAEHTLDTARMLERIAGRLSTVLSTPNQGAAGKDGVPDNHSGGPVRFDHEFHTHTCNVEALLARYDCGTHSNDFRAAPTTRAECTCRRQPGQDLLTDTTAGNDGDHVPMDVLDQAGPTVTSSQPPRQQQAVSTHTISSDTSKPMSPGMSPSLLRGSTQQSPQLEFTSAIANNDVTGASPIAAQHPQPRALSAHSETDRNRPVEVEEDDGALPPAACHAPVDATITDSSLVRHRSASFRVSRAGTLQFDVQMPGNASSSPMQTPPESMLRVALTPPTMSSGVDSGESGMPGAGDGHVPSGQNHPGLVTPFARHVNSRSVVSDVAGDSAVVIDDDACHVTDAPMSDGTNGPDVVTASHIVLGVSPTAEEKSASGRRTFLLSPSLNEAIDIEADAAALNDPGDQAVGSAGDSPCCDGSPFTEDFRARCNSDHSV